MLSKLQASSKPKLMAGATFEELERATVICHEEAPAVCFSLVLRGEVKLVIYSTKPRSPAQRLANVAQDRSISLHASERALDAFRV